MPDIFLSYRRDDSADTAGRMYDRLEADFGDGSVFKDVDSIPVGFDFRKILDQSVSQCRIFLAVIGPNWLTDRLKSPKDFVRIEIESALKRDIPVVPVLVNGGTMPEAEALPDTLADLVYRHAFEVRRDPHFRRDMDGLRDALRESLKRRTPETSPPPHPRDSAQQIQLAWDFAEYEKTRMQSVSTETFLLAHAPSRLVDWKAAAEAGDPRAMTIYGDCYEEGVGLKKDHVLAVKWYRQAAELGDAMAMTNLGCMYDEGQGVTQDYAEALKWYRKAAELGNPSAMYNLGYAYDEALGVTQDYVEALKWYRKAAELGNLSAMFNLGYAYDEARGVKQDYAEALKWYRKAAELGNAMAMNNLGAMYELGQGVAKNRDKAISWFRKAAKLGNDLAKEWLESLGVAE